MNANENICIINKFGHIIIMIIDRMCTINSINVINGKWTIISPHILFPRATYLFLCATS